MREQGVRPGVAGQARGSATSSDRVPGKRTLVEQAQAGIAPTPTGLPGPVLAKLSRAFGADFSQVRVHVDSPEAEAKHARAYTQGLDIHFAPGQYDPESQSGQELIAHELAHVVQQASGRVSASGQAKGKAAGVNDDVALEREADGLGERAARGEIVGAAGALAGVPAGPIQRKTTIVDDPTDPQNAVAKGTGRGLLKSSKGNTLPARDCVFGPLLNECATHMEAWIDTNNYDPAGTEPKAGTWPSWWAAAAPKPNNYWVRGHLLNHNLGGPGEMRNLTPITKAANSEHHNNVEKVLKLAAELGGSLVGYRVTAQYNGTGPTGLRGDANDPDRSVWDKLTLGFDCEYIIVIDEHDQRTHRCFVENKR